MRWGHSGKAMTDKSGTPRTRKFVDDWYANANGPLDAGAAIEWADQLERENKRLREALENAAEDIEDIALLDPLNRRELLTKKAGKMRRAALEGK